MGAIAIFCFSFLLGSNFDYRLIFLLGVQCYLLEFHDQSRTWISLIAPGVLCMFLWMSRVSSRMIIPFELFDWGLFVVGTIWLVGCLISVKSSLLHSSS